MKFPLTSLRPKTSGTSGHRRLLFSLARNEIPDPSTHPTFENRTRFTAIKDKFLGLRDKIRNKVLTRLQGTHNRTNTQQRSHYDLDHGTRVSDTSQTPCHENMWRHSDLIHNNVQGKGMLGKSEIDNCQIDKSFIETWTMEEDQGEQECVLEVDEFDDLSDIQHISGSVENVQSSAQEELQHPLLFIRLRILKRFYNRNTKLWMVVIMVTVIMVCP